MIIVIDTNVLYQALRSNIGASHYILQLIYNRKINLALSIQVFIEYEDVLKRPEKLVDLGLKLSDIDKVLRFLAYIGKPFNTHFKFRPNLRDETDNIFVELAITSNSQFLITNNVKDFLKNKELTFDDLNVITPSNFIKFWRENYES